MINILIIEDTKLHQEKIKKVISELGYHVCGCFDNGEDAVQYINNHKNIPDLAIIDVILKSEMDGYEVARKIASKTDIPIIFLTGMEDNLKNIDFDDCGVYTYLNKPYNNQELINNMEMVLHRYSSHQKVKEQLQVIQAQNERLASILEGTNVGIWEWNVQTGETIFNERWAEIIGYTLEDLSPVSIDTWMKYTHPGDLEASNKMLEKHFKGEIDYYDVECRMKHKEGHWVWVQDRGKVISWTEDGKPLWMFGTHQDITERKQIENRLRFQSLVLNQIQDRVTVTDLNGVITYVNEAEAQALGYSRQKLIGATIEKFGEDPEQGATQREILEETLKCGTWRGEVVNQTVDGEEIYMDCRTQVVLDNEGNSIALAGIATDITKRKKLETELQESRNLLNSIFQSIQDGISVLNTDLTIREINQTMEKWYKHKMPFIGKKCYEVYQNRSEPCVLCPSIKALEKKDTCYEVVPLMGEDKPVGWIELFSYPLIDTTTENVAGVVEFVRDITHRKQIEQELIQRNQEVEQLNKHLNQEIEKAHQIHNHILPKEFPNIEGINFTAFYQPAETLGGDFYEVIQRDNKLVIYLSDISGHGLDGSMINFFVKEAIDSYITLKSENLTPKSILRHLERQFRRERYPDELFICIFLAVLDLETMELTYTRAGFQDTPFVKQGNGEQVKLSTTGLFINSSFPIDPENFQEKTITLIPGSTIFFNTDGLTEQGKPGTFYRDKLPQVFYENSHLPPEEISQALVEDFKSFNNGSMQGNDDITFLILQVEPGNTRYQLELTTDFLELEDLRKKTAGILPNVGEADVLINCLYELTANAMEHGNQMDPTKKVMVEFVVFHDSMQVIVEDEGAGFNWRNKIDKPFELEGLTERGRGIALARIMCNNLYYNNTGNKAICVVNYGQGGKQKWK